jgi:hypothetical protein
MAKTHCQRGIQGYTGFWPVNTHLSGTVSEGAVAFNRLITRTGQA